MVSVPVLRAESSVAQKCNDEGSTRTTHPVQLEKFDSTAITVATPPEKIFMNKNSGDFHWSPMATTKDTEEDHIVRNIARERESAIAMKDQELTKVRDTITKDSGSSLKLCSEFLWFCYHRGIFVCDNQKTSQTPP
ncbi:hypothetical protein DICVIV_05819 [Dictyocaulus viviparus]|uniref:Uncharacterized protein n=1 Tax=Dictyocaulus viviparus TaxID=29172 RepID=A0A0D8XU05_DICVI|nr:hypothetical protein DICVIV_05819 [Dictyocaulus viviparus]